MNLNQILTDSVKKFGDKTILAMGERRVSFRELDNHPGEHPGVRDRLLRYS